MTDAEKLAEAEAAYHKLMTGKSARVYVDSNGERVEYTVADANKLRAYIEALKRAVSGARLAPARPWF